MFDAEGGEAVGEEEFKRGHRLPLVAQGEVFGDGVGGAGAHAAHGAEHDVAAGGLGLDELDDAHAIAENAQQGGAQCVREEVREAFAKDAVAQEGAAREDDRSLSGE